MHDLVAAEKYGALSSLSMMSASVAADSFEVWRAVETVSGWFLVGNLCCKDLCDIDSDAAPTGRMSALIFFLVLQNGNVSRTSPGTELLQRPGRKDHKPVALTSTHLMLQTGSLLKKLANGLHVRLLQRCML